MRSQVSLNLNINCPSGNYLKAPAFYFDKTLPYILYGLSWLKLIQKHGCFLRSLLFGI